jgi:hypothetical protein
VFTANRDEAAFATIVRRHGANCDRGQHGSMLDRRTCNTGKCPNLPDLTALTDPRPVEPPVPGKKFETCPIWGGENSERNGLPRS